MKNIGTRLNLFESIPNNTVKQFNALFPECPLAYPDDAEVEVNELFTYYERVMTVNGETIIHDMKPLRELENGEICEELQDGR